MRIWVSIGLILFLLILAAVLSDGAVDLQVDYLWFRSLGYETYFWMKEGYNGTIDLVVGLAVFVFFFVNLRLTQRLLARKMNGAIAQDGTPSSDAERTKPDRLLNPRSVKLHIIIALILTVPVIVPIHLNWELALFYLYGQNNTGISDPVFGKDIAFYLFSYPFYQLIQKELITAFVLLVAAVAAFYYVGSGPGKQRFARLPKPATIHLGVLIASSFVFQAWGFFLQRYSLLYSDRHEPVFFGPGYVEVHYRLPLIWLQCILFLIIGTLTLYALFYRKRSKVLGVTGILFALVFALLHIDIIPATIDKLWVKPNPVSAEKQFMRHNINATLSAYKLDEVTTEVFDPRAPAKQQLTLDEKQDLSNIPVWDSELLDDVYNQLQAIRPYYRFPKIDLGRYLINGYYQQVNLSAREINTDKIPDESKSWENIHLRYTHGWGAVITPAYQSGEAPMQCFLCDINLNSKVGFQIAQPQIYFGQEDYEYAIVPNLLKPIGTDPSELKIQQAYSGRDGVSVSSILSKLLFAVYFKDSNFLFSSSFGGDSRILLHRNILDRVQKLVPFLHLDKDPYLVVTPGGLFWVIDAYTSSKYYPVSKHSYAKFSGQTSSMRFNYIRNSVKIVIDAYHGSTDFYIIEPNDPIVRTLNKAFPGLFKQADAIPGDLKPHLRYPRDLFAIQMQIYSKYHQTKPELFFQGGEFWEFSKMDGANVTPYYLTIHQGALDEQIFVLVSPMTPIGLDNLSVLAVAGCFTKSMCGDNYAPRMIMFKFPVDIQIDGPAQITALINQNPEISRQITLWNQRGSEVKRGRMLILPIGNDILYIQPVYLLSTAAAKIPQLVRVIVSKGRETVMDVSLESALRKINDRLGTISEPVAPE